MVNKNEAEPRQGIHINTGLSLGLIVILLPTIGYAVAFLYEVGFCLVFGIPVEFIQITVTNVFIAVAISAMAVGFAWALVNSLVTLSLPLWRKWPTFILMELMRILPLVVIVAIMILFFRDEWIVWIFPLSWVVLYGVYLFVLPLFLQRGKLSYADRLFALRSREKPSWGQMSNWNPFRSLEIDEQTKPDIQSRLAKFKESVEQNIPLANSLAIRSWLQSFINPIFIILLVFSVAFFSGQQMATYQQWFLVPSTHQDTVVVKIYGDNVICVPYDNSTKVIQKQILVLKMGQTNTTYELKKIGRLTLASQ
jgi:hypothetical protein